LLSDVAHFAINGIGWNISADTLLRGSAVSAFNYIQDIGAAEFAVAAVLSGNAFRSSAARPFEIRAKLGTTLQFNFSVEAIIRSFALHR